MARDALSSLPPPLRFFRPEEEGADIQIITEIPPMSQSSPSIRYGADRQHELLHIDAWRRYLAAAYNVWTVDPAHNCIAEQPPCMHRVGVVVNLRNVPAVAGACGNARCPIDMWGCVLSGQYHICKPKIRPCRLASRSVGATLVPDQLQVGRSGSDVLDLYTCSFSHQILYEEHAAENWYDDTSYTAYWRNVEYSLTRGEFEEEKYHYDLYTGAGASEFAMDVQKQLARQQRQRRRQAHIDAFHISDMTTSRKPEVPKKPRPPRIKIDMKHATPDQRKAAAMARVDMRTRQREQKMGPSSAIDNTNGNDKSDGEISTVALASTISLASIENSIKRAGKPRRANAARNGKKRSRASSVGGDGDDDDETADVGEDASGGVGGVNMAAARAVAASHKRRHVWSAHLDLPVPMATADITEWAGTWPADIIPEENVKIGTVDAHSIAAAFKTGTALVVSPLPSHVPTAHDVYSHLVPWNTLVPSIRDVYSSFVCATSNTSSTAGATPGKLTFYDPVWCSGTGASQRQCCKTQIANSIDLVCCDYYWQERMFPGLENALQPHLDRLAETIAIPMPSAAPAAGATPRHQLPMHDVSEMLLFADMKSSISCDHFPRHQVEHGTGVALRGAEAVATRIVACLMEAGIYHSDSFHAIVRENIGSSIPAIHAAATLARASEMDAAAPLLVHKHLFEYASHLPPSILDSLVLGLRALAGDDNGNLVPYKRFTAAVIALLAHNLHPSALCDVLTPPEETDTGSSNDCRR